jgi:DNA primase
MSAVEDVKAKLDIVEVIGGYVALQKAGRYFKANCPFHTEKTPSFYVYPERQGWHCFGACATGGDVISFVSRKENLDFTGALRLLAERAGVELRNDAAAAGRRQEIKTLQDANEAAAVYFHGMLQTSERAKAYVAERGLDAKTVSEFQIGYAPPGWQNLRDHLMSRGYTEAQLVEAGLLVEPDPSRGQAPGLNPGAANGGSHEEQVHDSRGTGGSRRAYDRFRDRLIFPIRDDRGRVAGFGGREMPDSTSSQAGAKYVNTPQSPVFDKSGLLYGLDRAKDELRNRGVAVIVEGYMDVIAAHQHGYRNVVASMGTALTEKQATLLQRFILPGEGRVVLAMDADEAGKAANLRAIQVVAAAERPSRVPGRPRSLDLRVMALPRGKDPDELIRGEAGAWEVAVEAARPVVDHLIAVTSSGLDLAQPRDRSTLVAEVLPAIGEVADPVLRAHYLQRLSRLARVSEEALRLEMRRGARNRQPFDRLRGAQATSNQQQATINKLEPGAVYAGARGVAGSQREAFCLALLHASPGLRKLGLALDENLFSLSEHRELFLRWRDGRVTTEEEEGLWEPLQLILATKIPFSEPELLGKAFVDCVERLERVTIRAAKEASALALAESEAGVQPGKVASLARARLGAGKAEDTIEDADTLAAASQFLEDMEAGLRFHRRMSEGANSDHRDTQGG